MFKLRLDRESEDHRKSLPFVLGGFALEPVSAALMYWVEPLAWGLAVSALSTIFFGIGLAYLARSKQRSTLWSGLAVFGIVGWFLVAWLEEGHPSKDIEGMTWAEGVK